MKVVFGVDVGGTTIKIGLFNEKKELIQTKVIRTNRKENGKFIIKEIVSEVKKILKNNQILESNLLGVGFGVPGPTIKNLVVWCPNIGWKNLDLEKEFINELGFKTKVRVTNDATAAAYGEYSFLNEEKNLAFMTLGTGVGGGLVIDGKIVEGTHGAAGEFGHLQVEYENPQKCSCGLYGCLETTASIRGIKWTAQEVLRNSTLKSSLHNKNLNPPLIFNSAEQGDQLAIEIVDKVGEYIARAAAKISAVVDPDVLVIGGGISNAGNILIEAIEKSYKKYSYFGTKDLKFRIAELKNDSGMYGASELIFNG